MYSHCINIFSNSMLSRNIFPVSKIFCRKFSSTKEIICRPKIKYFAEMCAGIGTCIMANAVYSVMRAKGRGNTHNKTENNWDSFVRSFSFLVGFPFTMFPYACIQEGSNKIFGLDLKFLD